MKDLELTREGLLSALLAWYADPRTWEARTRQAPYSSGPASRASSDAGRVARAAVAARSVGELLTALCDAHEVPLTALGRRAEILDPRMAEIARGSDPTPEEAARISRALMEAVQC